MNDKPTSIVIFGASGDLTRRKLIPALFNSYCKKRLPAQFNIIGYARRDWDHDHFRDLLLQGMHDYAEKLFEQDKWEAFAEHITYFKGNLTDSQDFGDLKQYLHGLEDFPANRLYYLAIAPNFFISSVKFLGENNMVEESEGWRRIVIEKPFGRDLQSARDLNDEIHKVFQEQQIYRIDHYLGKETAQNILYFRFANTIFEPVWNRNYIDNVQISVTESVDVGHRAGYYDEAGVVRDMFQNHLMQLLSLVAMEPPASFKADAVRNEKFKLFSSIRSIDLSETVRAQYDGYLDAEGVKEGSQTPTYAALTMFIDNWRWKGVPFYLRSGKALKKKNTEIIIQFEQPPHLMFEELDEAQLVPNVLSMCIQPDEGAHFQLQAKIPDSVDTQVVTMEFHYRNQFKDNHIPDAYERLLLDAIRGDASLFTRSDGIEAAWEIIDPVIQNWESDPSAPPMVSYEKGAWGPVEADELLGKNGRIWRHGCTHE